MTSFTPKIPSVSKTKSVAIPHPKSATAPQPKPIQWPKLTTPFTGIKPLLFTGGLPVAMSNVIGKASTGQLSNAAAKTTPKPKTIEQQVASEQKLRMINIKRVEAAMAADKRADAKNRRGLK